MNILPLRSCVGVLALSALPLLVASRAEAAPSKVACIGEQTTKSNEAQGPMWPALLATALGSNYDVVDEGGDTAGTILTGYTGSGSAHPYMEASNTAYEDSLTANIVVIGPMGEHDERAVAANASLGTEMIFETDYLALVDSFLNDPLKPTVYVTTPIQVPSFDTATQMYVTNVVLPAVQAVATKRPVKLIDLYTAFLNHTEYFMGMGDGQTNPAGEVKLEQMVADALNMPAGGAGGTGGAGSSGGAGGAGGASGGMGGGGAPGASAGGGGTTSAGGTSASAGTSANAGSTSATGGSGGSAAPVIPEAPASDSGGCSIGAPIGSGAGSSGAWLTLAAALGLTRLRRRRTRR